MLRKEQLTEKQLAAIKEICALYKTDKKTITICANAGTGKTSLIPFIIEELGIRPFQVAYVAFTGKAARVLREKGLVGASTIHKLIYSTRFNKRTGEMVFYKKEPIDLIHLKLIVVDEVSMVGQKLMDDLKSYNIPLLCLGDDAQLPPVEDTEGNKLLRNPDVRLTEIFRQKDGSSILDVATDLRCAGKPVSCNINDNEVRTIKKEDLTIEALKWADQILCCKNGTKDAFNAEIRKSLGFTTPYPQSGDKVICLKNYWNVASQNSGEPLTNGTTGTITAIVPHLDRAFDKWAEVTFAPDYAPDDYFSIGITLNPFFGLATQSRFAKSNRCLFDFGYAITVHKSQGSQWEKVLFYAGDIWGDPLTKHQLAYTAVTRAQKKLVYVQ